jgi:TPR repeat protein
VRQDSKEAAKWLGKSAEQGSAAGQFYLGWSFHCGAGVPKDDVEAVKWYRKSAEQGAPLGQQYLGWSFYLGEGVLQDYVEAYKWLQLAAAQGSDAAKHSLAEVKVWMTSDQVTNAQRLVREFTPTKTAE